MKYSIKGYCDGWSVLPHAYEGETVSVQAFHNGDTIFLCPTCKADYDAYRLKDLCEQRDAVKVNMIAWDLYRQGKPTEARHATSDLLTDDEVSKIIAIYHTPALYQNFQSLLAEIKNYTSKL